MIVINTDPEAAIMGYADYAVIGDIGKVLPGFAHPGARLTYLTCLPGASHIVARSLLHGRLGLTGEGKPLPVHLVQSGFRIEGIDMAWPPFHHEENAILCLGWKVRFL